MLIATFQAKQLNIHGYLYYNVALRAPLSLPAREVLPVRTRSTHQRRTTRRQHLNSTSLNSRSLSLIEAPVCCRDIAEEHAARQKLRPLNHKVHVLPSSVLFTNRATCLLRTSFVRFRTIAKDKANTCSQSPGRCYPKLHKLSKSPALFPGTTKPHGLVAHS